jgi:hypothetical protein
MQRTRFWLLAPSFGAVMALAVAGLHPVDNSDSFGHLAAGRQIATRGHVPSLDTFSYFRPTPQPWVNYEWLSDLALFEVWHATGFAGLIAVKLVLIAAVSALLVRLAFERAGPLGARLCALALILSAPALRYRLSVRPHMFGLYLSGIYWFGLLAILDGAESVSEAAAVKGGGPGDVAGAARERGRSRGDHRVQRWVIGLACAHVAWVNLHGSHLLGIALTIAALVASLKRPAARKPLLELLGLEAIASCISPYGPKIVAGAIAHVFDPRYRLIVGEWQAWSPAQPLWFALGLLLQALFVALAWRGLPKNACGHFQRFAALLLLLMAARSMRFIADFLLLTAPLVGEGIAAQFERWRIGRSGAASESALRSIAGRAAWLAAFAASSGFAFWMSLQLPPHAAFGFGADTRTLPAASAAWLSRERPQARVFAAMEDGWFLMWAAPQTRQLIDGRVPFYGPDHMLAMAKAWSTEPTLQKIIAATRTDAVIVQPVIAEHQAALASMLKARDFRLVMIENKQALFVRAQSDNPAETRAAADAGFHELSPGYVASWLLARTTDVAAIRRELAGLRAEPNAGAYVAWVDALLALRPLARAEGRAGFAPPLTTSEHAGVRFALERLRPLRAIVEDVPSLSAYRALAATLACELDEAEAVLRDVREEDSSRESIFARQELALRRGDRHSVKTVLEAARALPEAANDPWLAALERALDQPNSCAAASGKN